MLLYLTLLEGFQHFVPGRTSHFIDLTANTIVVLARLAVVALWRSQQDVRMADNKFH